MVRQKSAPLCGGSQSCDCGETTTSFGPWALLLVALNCRAFGSSTPGATWGQNPAKRESLSPYIGAHVRGAHPTRHQHAVKYAKVRSVRTASSRVTGEQRGAPVSSDLGTKRWSISDSSVIHWWNPGITQSQHVSSAWGNYFAEKCSRGRGNLCLLVKERVYRNSESLICINLSTQDCLSDILWVTTAYCELRSGERIKLNWANRKPNRVKASCKWERIVCKGTPGK